MQDKKFKKRGRRPYSNHVQISQTERAFALTGERDQPSFHPPPNKPDGAGIRPYRAPIKDAPTMVRIGVAIGVHTIVGAIPCACPGGGGDAYFTGIVPCGCSRIAGGAYLE